MLHRLKPPLEGRWHRLKPMTERCWGSGDSRRPPHNVLRQHLSVSLRLPAPLKGSPWMMHRLKPPLEGRWRAQRDGEVLGQWRFPQVSPQRTPVATKKRPAPAGRFFRQHRTIWQEHSAKDFASYESYKRAGILYVFPPFITARMGQKIGRRPQTQLCGAAFIQIPGRAP